MEKSGMRGLASAMLVVMTFALGFAEFVLIGIVNPVAQGLGATITEVGNVVSLYALACAVGTPVIALATARVPRFKLFAALLVIFNLGNLLTVFTADITLFSATRVLPAISGGTLMAMCMTYVPEVASKGRVALLMSLVLAGYSVSSVIGVPVGTFVASEFGWKSAYMLVLVFGALASVTTLLSIPRGDGASSSSGSLATQFKLIGDARVLLNVAMMVFVAGSTYVFYTYLTPVLENVMGLDVAAVSLVLGVFGVACVLSNILSGWIAERGGLHVLPIVFAIQAVLLAATSFTVDVAWMGICNIVLIGVVMYAMNSTAQLLFQDVARKDYPQALTLAASLHPMAFNAGIALGSFIGGVVVAGPGIAATGPVGAIMAAVGALLACVLYRVNGKSVA